MEMELGENNKDQDPTKHRGGLSFEVLEQLTKQSGPLTIEELQTVEGGPEIVDSAEFQNICRILGWPNHDDEGIAPAHEYTTIGFHVALVGVGVEEIPLNNFPLHLHANPAKLDVGAPMLTLKPDGDSFTDATYGRHLYLQRAYAIAPELMHGLHDRIRASGPAYSDRFADFELRYDAYIAYRLLGRLMKTTDVQELRKSMGADVEPGVDLITDAHEQLVV